MDGGEEVEALRREVERLGANLAHARHLVAQQTATRVLAEAASLADAMPGVLDAICSALEWDFGVAWMVDGELLHCRAVHQSARRDVRAFEQATRKRTFQRGVGIPGRVWATGQPVWIDDVAQDGNFPRMTEAAADGLHGAFAFPLRLDGDLIGVMEFFSRTVQPPDDNLLAMMATIGIQIGLFIRRTRAQEAVADTKARLELALVAGGMGTWDYDLASGRVTWSAALEDIHGLPRGSFGGTFEDFQLDLHPDDRDRVLAAVHSALQQRGDYHVEYRIMRPDGQVRWLEARGRVVVSAAGEPVRMAGICQDVTERKQAARALEISETLHTATLLSVGDAVITTDTDGQVTLMNGLAQDLTGWTLAEARGRPLGEVFQIDDGGMLQSRTGGHVPIDDSAAPIVNRDGHSIGVVMVFRDVSERRHEESRRIFISEAAALLASSLDHEQALRAVAELAVARFVDWCVIDEVDGSGILRRVAVAHQDPAKIALAREIVQRYPPDPASAFGVHAVIRSGKPEILSELDALMDQPALDDEHRALARGLGLRSYLIVPIKIGVRVRGTISFVNAESRHRFSEADLRVATELASCAAATIQLRELYRETENARRAAEAAAERTLRLSEVAAALSEAATPDQVASVVTSRGAATVGASGVAVMALSSGALHTLRSHGFGPAVMTRFARVELDAPLPPAQVARSGQPMFVESRAELDALYPGSASRRAPGRGAVTALPLQAGGRIIGVLALEFDGDRRFDADERARMTALAQLTAHALARASLLDAEQRARHGAEAASRAREELLAIVSHDLRNPLNSISMSAGMLERALGPEAVARVHKYVENITRAADGMSHLISDLLDLASLEAGRLVIQKRPSDANASARDAIELLGPVAAARGITLRALTPQEPTYQGDRERVLQILSNLIGNAIKFSPEGGTITVQVEQLGAEIIYIVADDGPGISPEQLPHIFDRYWQADRESRLGVGLGLSIAKALVEAQGGRIWVDSTPVQGARFHFSLPAAGEHELPRAAPEPARE